MKRSVILCFSILLAELFAVVPPQVPGLSLPVEMLENIRRDSGFYMPGVALSQRMQLYRQQKLSAQRDGAVEPDPVIGYLPVLCMQYADVDSEWPISQMANQMFDTNADWPTGSMTDYYEEISYGAFSVTGAVHGWIHVSGNSEYYDRENGHTYELIIEALTISDPDIDFSLYDSDGPDGLPNSGDDDGYVDEIALIHSGTGGEYGGPQIWSHSWSLQGAGGAPYTTDDPGANGSNIMVNDYVIQPAVTPNSQMEEIGVFCHEYGHALGLPDLYDRTPSGDGDSEGVGNWALMAGGGSEGSRPSHMCAWSKEIMGWVTPIVLTENWYDHPLPAVEDTAIVYKLWAHGELDPFTYVNIWDGIAIEVGREYFLVENRQLKKFDDELPEEGLLIWHIQNFITTQNDDETNKLVDLEAADNFFDMDMGRNRGDDGDPYPGSENNRTFDRTSFPNSGIHAGGFSKVAVRNISDSGDTMFANLSVVANDLMYLSNSVDDYSGDGNGYADPGDSVRLTLEFQNLGADIPSFEFTLTTDDPDITILDSLSVYSNILEDSSVWNSTDDFMFTVHPGAVYHPIMFEVNGTDGTDHSEYYQFTVMMENLKILIVDDSGGETDEFGKSIMSFYEDAFTQANISHYSTWQIYYDGLPALDVLNNYRTLVWMTGSNQLTLSANEQIRIKDYLDGGSSLLISGQNIGRDLVATGDESDSLFYADYLRAEFRSDEPGVGSNILLTGIENDPISGNYRPYFFISGGNSANNQVSPDIIAPINGADGAMEYFGTGVMGEKSGIKFGGEYRLVYYSFGLEGINEQSSTNITRGDLLKRSIGWLQEDPSILTIRGVEMEMLPNKVSLHQNYPNPFNPVTNIRFDLPVKSNVKLVIYDLLGKEVTTLLNKNLFPGQHAVVWNGTNAAGRPVGSGIYFYQLETGEFISVKKMMFLK